MPALSLLWTVRKYPLLEVACGAGSGGSEKDPTVGFILEGLGEGVETFASLALEGTGEYDRNGTFCQKKGRELVWS